jgi:hypothetical protein
MARTLKLVNGGTYAIPALEKELKKGDTVEVPSSTMADLLLEDAIVDSNNNVKPYFEEVEADAAADAAAAAAAAAPTRARARKATAPAGDGEGDAQ